MEGTSSAVGPVENSEWLELCRRAVERQAGLFSAADTIAERDHYEGVGEGGDHTLRLDRQCEDIVMDELERLAKSGHAFTAISEERGTVDFNGGGPTRVVIDPIDGSLNVRRTLPSHSLSVAVASGETMDTVGFGFVHDFGAGEEFRAVAGEGAFLDDRPLREGSGPDQIEIVGVEGAEPGAFLPYLEGMIGSVYRLRCVGSLALTLCYLGAGRFDGVITPHPCRSVDAAAAQLVAREAGAVVEMGTGEPVRFDLDRRFPIVGARSKAGLDLLRACRPDS